MGAAMAPAASATLLHYLRDTHAEPPDFDAIYTGDLGHVGSQLFRELLAAEGLLIKNHVDCGCILYDASEQAVKSGGSGAGCSRRCSDRHILPRLERGTQKRVLFLATGALMSQTTFLQKESIPAVAHLVELAAPEKRSRIMNYLWAFVVGGGICRRRPAPHRPDRPDPRPHPDGLCGRGSRAVGPRLVAPLAELAGCGATVPLLGFGHLLAKGVRTALQEEGAIGILTGGLTAAAAGITTSLVCGVVCSWVGRSHDQN